MHVRAYNYWVSLLAGRAFPSIADLDPASLGDFGPHSVLLDFSGGADDPKIPWLGRALRDEGQLGDAVRTIADVPGRSLLSRLTDHCLQIVANRAPIGFEAEFVNVRGNEAMYRGILMPFSSDGATIDYIYGVINWKELADARLTADIVAAADVAIAAVRAQATVAPSWADGPSRSFRSDRAQSVPQGFPADPVDLDAMGDDASDDAALLADRLAAARDCAEAVASSEVRSRAALYRAIAHAYDFACAAEAAPEAYAELLDDAGVKMQARAPMTPIAKLVFGVACDKTRLAEYAAVLGHARRLDIEPAAMARFLDGHAGGLKAIVAAARAAGRPAAAVADPRVALRAAEPVAVVELEVADDYVLLVARRDAAGAVAILGEVPGDSGQVDRALRRFARTRIA